MLSPRSTSKSSRLAERLAIPPTKSRRGNLHRRACWRHRPLNSAVGRSISFRLWKSVDFLSSCFSTLRADYYNLVAKLMRLNTAALLVCLVCADSPVWPQTSTPPPNPALGSSHSGATLDEIVVAEMRIRQIPGLSLAIVQDGKIVKAQGYGTTEKGGQSPVTARTLFQAGSISKPVSALGALRFVEQRKLTLDEDVNTKLVTWKVPENEFTKQQKVTLRGLLSHTAGLTVHGFPGYAADEPRPTVVQILDGTKPANTPHSTIGHSPGQRVALSAAATQSCSN